MPANDRSRTVMKGRPRILVIGGSERDIASLDPQFKGRAEVSWLKDGEAAYAGLTAANCVVIVNDPPASESHAIEMLRRIRSYDTQIPVCLIFERFEADALLAAGRLGAAACFLNSEAPQHIANRVIAAARAFPVHARSADGAEAVGQFIGGSLTARRLLAQCEEVAKVDTPVLITGEHGVGKEVLARHIHAGSRRSRGEFLAVNCGAIPEGLVESELFGHERGSFTGAVKQHRGKFELAAGGTLLLDEITEMPLALQPTLLRVLQTREFMRVGGEETLRADARVICSTNRDPLQALDEGRLRHDLFYRINAVTLHVPPLRERREDVVLLARHFLAQKSRLLEKRVTRFTETAESLMLSYDWPGNVRELMNVVECAVVFCRTDEIGPELLTPISAGAAYLALPWDAAREVAIRRFELSYLSTLMRINRGSVVRCAKAMRMSRQALYKLLERTGLDASTFRSRGSQKQRM